MQYLARNFQVVSLHELIHKLLEPPRVLPSRNFVAITFDDGYDDIIKNVYTITSRYKIPISVFISTGAIGQENFFWWDRVGEALRCLDQKDYKYTQLKKKISSSLQNLLPKTIGTTEKNYIGSYLKDLKKLPNDELLDLVSQLESLADTTDVPIEKNRVLDWTEIRKLHRNGVDFYPHTVTHPILTRIPTDQAYKEIHDSILTLKNKLKTSHYTNKMYFAYPNGGNLDFNEEIIDILKNNGVKGALTMINGINKPGDDLFRLKRIAVGQESLSVLALKMSGLLF